MNPRYEGGKRPSYAGDGTLPPEQRVRGIQRTDRASLPLPGCLNDRDVHGCRISLCGQIEKELWTLLKETKVPRLSAQT